MQQDIEAKANAAFKKEQRAIEATVAWDEYEANKAHVDANMMRLRALRLAREGSDHHAGSQEEARKEGRLMAVLNNPTCKKCGEASNLVRITPIANADHDSRVYQCKACGNLHTILMQFT